MRPSETGPPLGQLLGLPASPEEERDTPRIVIAISIACMGLQDHPAQHDRALHDPITCLEYTIMSETHDELPIYAEKYPDEVSVNPPPEYKVGYKRPPP